MNVYVDTDPVAEVRHNRELLLEMYGGIDGLLKHMDEERPVLEAQGWVFTSMEEILSNKSSVIDSAS
jgi:hypothetical protein